MRSIRKQLTLGVLVALGLLLGGAGGATYWALRESIYDQFDDALRVKALFIVTSTQQRNNQIKVEFSDGFLREFDYDVAMDFFQVFDEKGASLTRSDSLWGRDLPLRTGTLEAPVYWDLELPNGKPGRAIGIEFAPDQQNRRGLRKETGMLARVVVASDRSYIVGLIAKLNVTFAIAGAAMVGVIVLAVPLVLRRGLRPLNDVAEQASRIDANSLTERFPVEQLPSELKPIAGRLNDLLARLSGSFERERRFSANLAHELRTPLAELRSQAELALKWPEERSADNDRTVLEIALQMEALVTRMLELARAEQAGRSVDKKHVELAALVDDVLEPLTATIGARRLTLRCEIERNAALMNDPVLLRSIVSNLLENAVHYSSEGGEVSVVAEMAAKSFVFRVSNPTDNLRADDLPRLFERFWRKDGARTGGGAHAGLGLALAKSLAEQLGCELTASLDSAGVVTMTLRGPR
jgi:signal transduction histidine kinase